MKVQVVELKQAKAKLSSVIHRHNTLKSKKKCSGQKYQFEKQGIRKDVEEIQKALEDFLKTID